jgi:hypothetical protein
MLRDVPYLVTVDKKNHGEARSQRANKRSNREQVDMPEEKDIAVEYRGQQRS